jgi:hypothetical protein
MLLKKSKYVICIPKGCGFNDVLCQINEAYKFSQKSNRTLLIDTRLSGLADSLSNYFDLLIPDQRIKLNLRDEDLFKLNKLTCFPNEFEGKIDWIYHRFAAIDSKKMDTWRYFNSIQNLLKLLFYVFKNVKLNSISLKFKFIANYLNIRKKKICIQFDNIETHPAELIVHHMSGGGEESIKTLSLLKFKNEIINKINLKINFLGLDYDAIHIRNTDYKSEYITFFEQIKPKTLGRRILLCTDNPEIMFVVKETMGQTEIVFIEKYFPRSKTNNSPIHFQWKMSKETIQLNNVIMLADLIGMAKSKNLYYPNLTENIHLARFSGFSKLAENLKSRPELVDQLMGGKLIS